MALFKFCFELVFGGSANFCQVVFHHVTIGAKVAGLVAGQSLRGCLAPPHHLHFACGSEGLLVNQLTCSST